MSAAAAVQVVLGTVQLGRPYARRMTQELMSQDAAFAILDAAWDLGIRAFDVAEAYGEACKRLARWLDARGTRRGSHIVTKVRIDDVAALPARLHAALNPFDEVATLTLLTHGAAGPDTWRLIRDVALKAGALPGQSVYEPAEVRAAVEAAGICRVQAPGNLFDRRALEARADRVVPLDLRSVYLQGVLLEPPEAAERRAPGAGVLATAVQAAARAVSAPVAAMLVAATLHQVRPTDRLVIGVDDPKELRELALGLDVPSHTAASFRHAVAAQVPILPDQRTLDPRTWPTAT